MSLRVVQCSRCGVSFWSSLPHDPARDTGFGTCDDCHARIPWPSWVPPGDPRRRKVYA